MPQTIAVGSVLADTYCLEAVLGDGGMGVVYEASHRRLPRRFAVKVLNASVVHRHDLFERFRREAEIASGIGHEHIVEAYDFNKTEDGIPYIVMERLQGESLGDRLEACGLLDIDQTLSIMRQLAEALAAAHAEGIVHRDLKPDNVYLCKRGSRDDHVKVLDFGVSKLLHSETVSTESGMLIGTPHYMSPEQASEGGAPIDQRTDVFALGVIAYQCLTGRLPFEGSNSMAVLYQVCHQDSAPMRRWRADLPAAADSAVMRALAKRPQDRYGNVGDFVEALVAACGGQVSETLASSDISVPRVQVSAADVQLHERSSVSEMETLHQVSVSAAAKHSKGPSKRARWYAFAGGLLLASGVAGWQLARVDANSAHAERGSGDKDNGSPAAGLQGGDKASSGEPQPGLVTIELGISPQTARVELDGVATTERTLRLPRSERVHELVVSAPGYTPQRRRFGTSLGGQVTVHLEKRTEEGPMDASASASAEPPQKPSNQRARRGVEPDRTNRVPPRQPEAQSTRSPSDEVVPDPAPDAKEPASPIGPLERSL